MDSTTRREDTRRIAERAAEWLIQLEENRAEDRAAFAEWIGTSPQHLKEFLFMSALENEIGQMDPEQKIALQEILTKASGNVVPIRVEGSLAPALLPGKEKIETAAPIQVEKTAQRPFLNFRWAAGVAGIGVAVTLAWWALMTGEHTYQTSVGEQRKIELADGSIVQLNTGSSVQVDFSTEARDIRLLKGEALFDVERDPARPFRVRSGASVIQALGTQFNVLRRPSGTVVSVLEGVVRVYSAARSDETSPLPGSDASLAAGEEVRIDDRGHVEKRKTTDVNGLVPWQRNRLVFRDDTLEDMAAEFNRYNSSAQIRFASDEVRHRRYTAVFDADDPRSLLEFLRQDTGLAVENRGKEILILTIDK